VLSWSIKNAKKCAKEKEKKRKTIDMWKDVCTDPENYPALCSQKFGNGFD